MLSFYCGSYIECFTSNIALAVETCGSSAQQGAHFPPFSHRPDHQHLILSLRRNAVKPLSEHLTHTSHQNIKTLLWKK